MTPVSNSCWIKAIIPHIFRVKNVGTLKIPLKMLKCVPNWIIKSSQTMVALYRHNLCVMSHVKIISPRFVLCHVSCLKCFNCRSSSISFWLVTCVFVIPKTKSYLFCQMQQKIQSKRHKECSIHYLASFQPLSNNLINNHADTRPVSLYL